MENTAAFPLSGRDSRCTLTTSDIMPVYSLRGLSTSQGRGRRVSARPSFKRADRLLAAAGPPLYPSRPSSQGCVASLPSCPLLKASESRFESRFSTEFFGRLAEPSQTPRPKRLAAEQKWTTPTRGHAEALPSCCQLSLGLIVVHASHAPTALSLPMTRNPQRLFALSGVRV